MNDWNRCNIERSNENTYQIIAQHLQKEQGDLFGITIGIMYQESNLRGPKIVYQYKGHEARVQIPMGIWADLMCGHDHEKFIAFITQAINPAMQEITKDFSPCLPSGRNAFLTHQMPESIPIKTPTITKEEISFIDSIFERFNHYLRENNCNTPAYAYPDVKAIFDQQQKILKKLNGLK